MARVKQIRRETQGISLIEGRSEFMRVIGRKNKGANVPFRLRFTTPPEDLHNVFERPFSPSAPVYLPAPRKKRRDVIFEPERGDTRKLRVRLRCVPNRVASPRSMKSAIMRRLGNEVHFDGSRTARRTEGLRILKVQGNLSWQFNWDRSACRWLLTFRACTLPLPIRSIVSPFPSNEIFNWFTWALSHPRRFPAFTANQLTLYGIPFLFDTLYYVAIFLGLDTFI